MADAVTAPPAGGRPQRLQLALLASVFVVAACGLAYELIAGALASYLLGDSVTQFSTIIGAYLFAMGIGSWLSKYVKRDLIGRFVQIEIAVGLVGGFAAAGLFVAFAAHLGPFRVLLYGSVLAVGILVGLEIPLVMRLLKREVAFNELVARVLSFDYLGALAVSILFPLLLVPHLGLVRSAMAFGLLNVAVALWALVLFRQQLARRTGLWAAALGSVALLSGGLVGAGSLTTMAEGWIYADEIIHAENTPYQRIVVTRWRDDVRLFLNQNLQFSSKDEYRYHEALVHPGLAGMVGSRGARRVLVLGGGDGFAVREVLKYANIETVTLVDLDPAMTRLFSSASLLRQLNGDALNSPKVKIVNADAARWLEENTDTFDFIVADFPDPSNYSIGKLYSAPFYRLLARHLAPHGRLAVQATSPFHARESFWTVVATLDDVGLKTAPYHALVPSFGEWGFILAGREAYAPPETYTVPLRFLTAQTTAAMFDFPADMAQVDAEPNRLNDQRLVRIFEAEWRHVVR